MINILSSLLPPSAGNTNSAANYTQGNSSFDDLLDSLSGNGAAKKAGSKTDKDKTDDLLNYIQQIMTNIDNSLINIGSDPAKANKDVQPVNPVDASNTSDFEAILASGGPLPTFLHEVDERLHLNATQQKALQDIAEENMNVTKSPEAIRKIAAELQQAGIG